MELKNLSLEVCLSIHCYGVTQSIYPSGIFKGKMNFTRVECLVKHVRMSMRTLKMDF